MANAKQLARLKKGTEVWNSWRAKNRGVGVDLRAAELRAAELGGAELFAADLRETNLSRANLSEAHLIGANLVGADLSLANCRGANLSLALFRGANLSAINLSAANLREANLTDTNLSQADLREANLSAANLSKADLREADLTLANLSKVDLRQADLTLADLSEAGLREADLLGANLSGAILRGSNFWRAIVGFTIFGNSDLSEAIRLEDIFHMAPSQISTDAFVRSKGKIPEVFLRGCGLSDADIEYAKLSNLDLSNDAINKILYKIYDLHAQHALQISPLFISYSHADSEFVDKIGDGFTKKGIRYWRDIHEMKAGRMETQIDRAISQNPTVLLILSSNSISSDWVEHEVRTARGLEKEMGRDVLCPVALDDSWKDSRWPKRIMEQIMEYNILDFSAWEDDGNFESMFRKLIDGLELFYKG